MRINIDTITEKYYLNISSYFQSIACDCSTKNCRNSGPVSNNYKTYLKKIRKIIISNNIFNLCLQIIVVNEIMIGFILILTGRNRSIESDEERTNHGKMSGHHENKLTIIDDNFLVMIIL